MNSTSRKPFVTVARREYLRRVRAPWFVVGTLLLPLFVAAAAVIGPRLARTSSPLQHHGLRVHDSTGRLAVAVCDRLETGNLVRCRVAETATPPDERDPAPLLLLDGQTLVTGTMRLLAPAPPSPLDQVAIRQAVVQAALEAQLDGGADAVRALLSGGALTVDLVGGGQGRTAPSQLVVALVGAFLLYMAILVHAVAVMRAVVEEKTSRMAEVLISAVRPFDLMMGKIVGVGAVGLTQLGVWCGLAAGALALRSASVPAAARLSEVADAALVLGFTGFFVGGYLMYAALYAAAGALCDSEDESQQAQLPVTLLLLVPVVWMNAVIANPDSAASTLGSLIPLFAPVLMFTRMVLVDVPFWQLLVAGGGVALSVPLIAALAGRVYRFGLLADRRLSLARRLQSALFMR